MAASNSSGVKSAFSAAGWSGGGQATVLDFNEVIDLPLDAYLPKAYSGNELEREHGNGHELEHGNGHELELELWTKMS